MSTGSFWVLNLPHPSFGHPPQIRKGDCTDYRVYAQRIWRGKYGAKMKNGLGHDVTGSFCVLFFVHFQKIVSRNPCLREDRSQCGTFQRAVIWHCQRRTRAVRVFAGHRDVIPFAHQAKSQFLKGFDNLCFRCVNRKLGH